MFIWVRVGIPSREFPHPKDFSDPDRCKTNLLLTHMFPINNVSINFQVSEKLLPQSHAELLVELLKELKRQLEEQPDRLPILETASSSPVRKPKVRVVNSKIYVTSSSQ